MWRAILVAFLQIVLRTRRDVAEDDFFSNATAEEDIDPIEKLGAS